MSLDFIEVPEQLEVEMRKIIKVKKEGDCVLCGIRQGLFSSVSIFEKRRAEIILQV